MFYEEARELLISLEEGLMDLERRQSDRAHLDKTFRAAHSLKGAAAMVGLGSIAEFTHGIEAVLERIRAGLLAVDSDIITTLLEARDHLAAMVEAEAARSPIPPSGELTAAARCRSCEGRRHQPADDRDAQQPVSIAAPPPAGAACRRPDAAASGDRPTRITARSRKSRARKKPGSSEGPKPRRSRAVRGGRRGRWSKLRSPIRLSDRAATRP